MYCFLVLWCIITIHICVNLSENINLLNGTVVSPTLQSPFSAVTTPTSSSSPSSSETPPSSLRPLQQPTILPQPPPTTTTTAAATTTTTKCIPYIIGEGGNMILGKTIFGLEPNCLPRMKMDDHGLCFLSNDVITVRDAKQKWMTSSPQHGSHVVSFPCTQGMSPSDAVNGASSPSLDAFRHMHSAVEMLHSWYRFPVRDKASLQIYVHTGRSWDNAAVMTTPSSFEKFHNGVLNSKITVNIFLGDGTPKRETRRFYISPSTSKNILSRAKKMFSHPFTTPNIVGHEMGHALIWMTSSKVDGNLDAQAIVEAFADMTGEILEYYVTGFVDWVTPSGLSKDLSRRRSFKVLEEPLNHQSSRLSSVGFNYTFLSQDVYTRGNVYRHVFYRLSQKYGIHQTYGVFLNSLRDYWSKSKHAEWFFEMAACGVLLSASGVGGVEGQISDMTREVIEHFKDFGVNVNQKLCKKYTVVEE